MYTFPDLIKRIREKANLTQGELAGVLSVSTVLIAMIETGQKPVSKNFIERLAKKMDVHPSSITPFIFSGDEFMTEKLSLLEKSLLKIGESLQDYLINTKSVKLREHV